jgi:hypothetical protein
MPTGGPAQLGTGEPEVDYHWNRGPFRTPGGTAVLFACDDEVSVRFHPATMSTSPAARPRSPRVGRSGASPSPLSTT